MLQFAGNIWVMKRREEKFLGGFLYSVVSQRRVRPEMGEGFLASLR